MPSGRTPWVWSDALREPLVALLEGGASLADAARAVRVTPDSLEHWLSLGRKGDARFMRLVAAQRRGRRRLTRVSRQLSGIVRSSGARARTCQERQRPRVLVAHEGSTCAGPDTAERCEVDS